jgi:hypothetical protein
MVVESLEVSLDGKISVYPVKRPAEGNNHKSDADEIVGRLR